MARQGSGRLRFTVEKVRGIAANTFRESIRQPVVLILLCIAVGMIVLSPYTTFFTLLQSQPMIKEMGLATMFVAGLLIAAFAASSVVSREIEARTVLSVLSKPVGRVEFIVGKYLGVLATLLLTGYVMSLVLVLTGAVGGFEAGALQEVHMPVVAAMAFAGIVSLSVAAVINYRTGRPFASTAVLLSAPAFTVFAVVFGVVSHVFKALATVQIDFSLILACGLVLAALGLLGAIAVAASTRLQTVMTLVLCSVVFLVGLLSDYLFFEAATTPGGGVLKRTLAQVVYSLVPNLQVLWMGDAVATSHPIPIGYVVKAGAYAVCYTVGILFIGILLFEDKQVS